MPLRLTILHLAQRFRTDGETFMIMLLTNFRSLHSQVFDYTRSSLLRLDYTKCRPMPSQRPGVLRLSPLTLAPVPLGQCRCLREFSQISKAIRVHSPKLV